MTESRTARRAGALRSFASSLVLAVLLSGAGAVLGVLAGPTGPASASLGSVPPDVTSYVSDGALIARLNNVYGPNASGTKGIAFDATTKAGPISRVYEWTAARLANTATDHPVQLTNNWVVPITIGGKSVGLATIWINPQTVEPELAQFAPDAALGTALTAVPATAALVRDTATGAWLALADSRVTPLVAGKSGLTTPAPVSSLTLTTGASAPTTAAAEPNTGLALAIGVVGLIVVVIVVALLVPHGRRARSNRTAGALDAAASAATAVPESEPEPESEVPEPAVAPEKEPATKPVTDPATKKPAIPKTTAVTPKPSGARPAGRTPTNSAASKPASSKPGAKPGATKASAAKPGAAKPPVSKPPAQKQPPRPRSPRPKPPAPDPGTASDS